MDSFHVFVVAVVVNLVGTFLHFYLDSSRFGIFDDFLVKVMNGFITLIFNIMVFFFYYVIKWGVFEFDWVVQIYAVMSVGVVVLHTYLDLADRRSKFTNLLYSAVAVVLFFGLFYYIIV